MKIVHICFSNSYNDCWGYQDNLLPEYMARLNTQNYVIASNIHFPDYMKEDEIRKIKDKGDNYFIGLVNVRRIKTTKFTSTSFIPHGLCRLLDEIKPDMIFHHNICIGSMFVTAQYAKKHKIPLVVDNHADELNMRSNKLWTLLYHKLLLRTVSHICDNCVKKYYGVTYSRCDFISKYYTLPKNKIELLPIGADTDFADTIKTKQDLRIKHGFSTDDIIVISGGKMGVHKGTDKLIRVVSNLNQQHPNIKLVLFGKFEDSQTEGLALSSDAVFNLGWCDRLGTLELLKLADVACWPIHHTTLIEDAIAVETPLVIRKTTTTQHLLNGNGIWLYEGEESEILESLLKAIRRENLISLGQNCKKMKEAISYRTIAEKVLSDVADEFN